MKNESYGSAIWRLARNVLIIELLIFAITALVCWFGGWHTAYDFGNGLIISGVVALGFGAASLLGNAQLPNNADYGYIQSVSPTSLRDRTKQNWLDLQDGFGFLSLMVVAGLLPIAIGWLIQILVR